jgi:hypothetical protein
MRVHLLTPNDHVELRRASGELVCRAPCDQDLWVKDADTFMIGGAGVVPSEPFTFQLHEEVTLHVQPTSLAARNAGKAILGVGGALAVAALVGTYAVSAACVATIASEDNACSSKTPFSVLLALDLAGAALAAAGGIIMLANPPTKFGVTGD